MTGYEVSTSPGRGRSLKATAAFAPGARIASFSNPLLALPSSPVLATTCASCLRADRPIRLCTGCRAVGYCSVDCQRAAWKHGNHKKECPVLKTALERSGGDPLPTPTRALLAVMLGGNKADEAVAGLEGNVEGFKKEAKAWEDIRLQAYTILAYTKIAAPDKTEYYAEMMCKVTNFAFYYSMFDGGQLTRRLRS